MQHKADTKQHKLISILAVVLISITATVLVLRIMGRHIITMSAEEYAEYSRFMALETLADRIEEEFYLEVPSRETLISGAAAGMLDTLNDPYARYYTAEEYDEYVSTMNGEYYGIGLLVGQPDDDGAAVLEVYEGSSSEKEGVLAGDIITMIDDESVSGMTLEELSAYIDERRDESIALALKRGKKTIEVTVKSGSVTVKHVKYSMLDKKTGYVSISMFTGNCAEEFSEAITELKNSRARSIIIDLRNNPGGSLDSVVEIADELLGKGMRIVSVGPADSKEEDIYEARGKEIGIPIAVLVNENSASASEILAAAIQENGIGAVVGTRTYGKGIVQTTMYVEDMAGWLKLTTDAYYTPDGGNIHGEGIEPDIYVELPEEYRAMAIADIGIQNDTQLQKALEYVRKTAG